MNKLFFKLLFSFLVIGSILVLTVMESKAGGGGDSDVPNCKAPVFRTASHVSYCSTEAMKQKSIVRMKMKEKYGPTVTFVAENIRFHIEFQGKLRKFVKKMKKGKWYTVTFILEKENPDNSFSAKAVAIK
ncbi:MAG: hypothetical protein GY754_32080 [bacterium]|nr:hypothetical protein [bacterium]